MSRENRVGRQNRMGGFEFGFKKIDVDSDEGRALMAILGIDDDDEGHLECSSGGKKAKGHGAIGRAFSWLYQRSPLVLRKDFNSLHKVYEGVHQDNHELRDLLNQSVPLQEFAVAIGLEKVRMDHEHGDDDCIKTFVVEMDIDRATAGWESCGYSFGRLNVSGTKDFDPNDVTRGGTLGGEQ